LAGDPRVERKQFGQHSPLIVGNRSGGVGTHGIPPENFQIEKSDFPPNQLIPYWLLVGQKI
jgi:hypothetical protein